MEELRRYPQQIRERRELVITGKKHNGCSLVKVLISTTEYDSNGNVLPRWDGAETWYSVQRYSIDGMPVGMKHFGPDHQAAMSYYMNNNF